MNPRINFNYSDDDDNEITLSFRSPNLGYMVDKFNDFLKAIGHSEEVGVVSTKPYDVTVSDYSYEKFK
jgi:hypothetical protein